MEGIKLSDKIKIGVKAIAWFLLVLLFLISIPPVKDATAWLFVAAVVAAFIIVTPIHFIKRHLKRKRPNLSHNSSYPLSVLAAIMLVVCGMALPLYYIAFKTEADPLVLPQVVLTNGEKKVVFQGMVHVGSETFYKSVVYDLENALAEGYVLFYEGVQPSDEEADQWFSNNLAGGNNLDDNYKLLADGCGVHFQLDYFELLGKEMLDNPKAHITADVNTRQMMDEWLRLVERSPELANKLTKANKESSDANPLKWLSQQSEGRKKIGGILCRALLTSVMDKHDESKPLSPVILDFRNKKLAEQIIQLENNKIYITYGAAHLPGVIKELKTHNPNWEVESVKWVRALETERSYEGDNDWLYGVNAP